MRLAVLLLPLVLLITCRPAARGVAIGDSITEQAGWVREYDPTMINEGRSGWTSAQLLERVQHDEGLRAEIGSAPRIAIQVGTNDLGRPDVPAEVFCQTWDRLVHAVRALAPAADIVVQTIYHWIPEWDDRVGTMNACISRTPGVRVANVEGRFALDIGSYLLPDGIHPNAVGDAAIVEELHRAR